MENEVTIIKLEDSNNDIFNEICKWNYNWWGIRDGSSYEKVQMYMKYSLGKEKLPHTYVALINNKPAGMYQLSMCDDLEARPDIYPWLVNVYVAEDYRNKGICRKLMETVKDNAIKAGLNEIYLYTKHNGLYEKFGWEFIEYVKTFREDSPIERLYKLDLKKEVK